MDFKVCNRCRQTKSVDEFYPSKRRYKFGREPYCKSCAKLRHQEDRKAHPERRLKYEKRGKLRTKLGILVRGARTRSAHSSLPYDIDLDWLQELWTNQSGRCAVTGIDLQLDQSIPRKPFSVSIDRIEPSKGYIRGNVRLVCLIVNLSLGDFGEEAFRTMVDAYVSRQ